MSEAREGPLLAALVEAGGVTADYHGRRVVRHFGDPAAEYGAATGAVALFDRSHRARVTVSGSAPARMLAGVLTGRIPEPPVGAEAGIAHGVATYHAVLTPKGKMITDLWAMLPGAEESPGILLDVPVAGAQGLLEHLAKVLPPRFARVADVSERVAAITVVGPEAPGAVSREVLGGDVAAEDLRASEEGGYWRVGGSEALLAMRTNDVWPEAFNVYGPAADVLSLWRRLRHGGARPAGLGVWSTLRVEAGRPAFGTDMDEGTIPVEAGIDGRAIDHTKGCYTGQEVIVRIRDRGHVNRHLRRLELGDVPTPAAGTALTGAGDPTGKVVGHVTSAVQSPKHGGVVALAYVRRGVDAVLLDGREIAVPPS